MISLPTSVGIIIGVNGYRVIVSLRPRRRLKISIKKLKNEKKKYKNSRTTWRGGPVETVYNTTILERQFKESRRICQAVKLRCNIGGTYSTNS